MNRRDWFPLFLPLLFLLACLVVELCLQKWKAVLAIGIVSGLYLVVGVPLFLLANKFGEEKQKQYEKPPDPETFAGFWSGAWIKSRGKRGLLLRVLFALIPFVLFFGFAAKDFFSGGAKDRESMLVFLAWVAVGLGGIAAMIIRDAKKRSAEKNDEKTAASGDLPGPDRREQWDEWLKNGLIDKEEYRALRTRAEQKDAGKPR